MPADSRSIQAEDIYSLRQPLDLRLSPDGSRLAAIMSESPQDIVRIWDTKTGTVLKQYAVCNALIEGPRAR